MKKFSIVVIALLLIFIAIPVSAQGQDTCPVGDGWVKIEPLSGLSYEYTAPEGKLIAESCYKVGSHNPVFQTYDPAQSSVTVTSTLFNSPGGAICTAPGVPEPGCTYQDLSHASFRLIDDPGTETPTTTPTETLTETPTDTPTPTATPTPPDETETPVVEVEVETGGNLLLPGLGLIGLLGVAGIQLIGRRRKKSETHSQ